MAPQRLPATRIAGIVAWTAASVTWGTALVAAATTVPAPQQTTEGTDPEPIVLIDSKDQEALAPLPTMPESGLVVLRYTPSEKPEPQVVVRRVVVSSPSGGGSATPSGGGSATAETPTKVKSSGS